ncbi:probable disease resistance protein RXW24L isoform X3 [Olea europaea var. sylvestris]|uniref:probable disease resistance protein RXW24L isoform X3 n=1 Tax=Olea europaea var. sylvestris TaxID=158386 RepID=UPI000C1D3100|nr:probable disease resistance protein RXW24L isoform X3 [Olea europaea var. sylvestris]
MAYAAVIYLNGILEQMSNPHLQQHQTPLQDQQIKSLQEKLNFTLDFLDDSFKRRSGEIQILEREIRDAVRKAADIFELYISKNFDQEGLKERQIRDQTFCEKFEIVADEIDSIKRKAADLKVLWGATDLHQSQRTCLPTGPSRLASSGRSDTVGFREDLMEIIDQLTGYQPALQIIQVTGMGGIGKTTLARNVYNHPHIEHHFDNRAWVSISQEYREREVLLSLLDSMKQLSDEMHRENRTEILKECLYKSLKGQRYLIVIDDIWTTEAWDSLRKIFPDDMEGSRIMLTSRLSSVVDSSHHSHQMQFLNATDSWNLLRREVFGEDSCPIELEEAGKEISENCKGLPLSLVVIGGHLSNANRTKDHWEYVAQNIKSVVTTTDANCSEILSLSYDYLPHYLKACFLYMGVFPEDDEIRVSKLIKLWVAEGFLKPVRGKKLEEVAEECLGDLISRNLIMISKKSPVGKIKTCGIHDMLRDLCLKKAQEEKVIHFRDKDDIFAESIKYSRRLCIHPDILHEEFKCFQSMGSLPSVHSILISFSEDGLIFPKDLDENQIYELVDGKLFPLLRVLDSKQYEEGFPFGEIKLVHLRYLAFPRYGEVSVPKTLPDFLGHLQTLIVDSYDVHLPEEIWRMTQLRHLLIGKCYLPCPTRSPIAGENFVLGNLLTLLKVSGSSCTKDVFERLPNLNKLGILNGKYDTISLGILVNLPRLETLKIISVDERVRVPINFTFPPNIKKLTLVSCKIAWKHMTIVGSMPNLEVLKLLNNGFGSNGRLEWEPTEGEFRKLKFLLLRTNFLEQWRASNANFRSLECLMLRGCFKLKEIPRSIGDIPTLQIIDLDDASPSVVTSAKQIQEEQEEFGNDIQVRVLETCHKFNHQQSEGLGAEFIANLESNGNELQACPLLSRLINGMNPPSKKLISGIVSRLLENYGGDDHLMLQFAVVAAIKKFLVRSSDNINILIEQGAVPMMASLLSSPVNGLRKERHCLFFVGESLSSSRYRKSYISRPALRTIDNIISYVDDTQIQVIIDNGALHCLCRMLTRNSNIIVTESTCYIISNIFGRTKDHIQAVIEAGIISPLLQLLQDADFFKAAGEVIYNATTKGTNQQIKFLVHEGCIERMCDLLFNPNEVHVIKICLEGLENILKLGEAEKNQGNPEDVNVFAQMIEDAGGLQKIKNLQTHDYSKISRIAVKILVTYWHQEGNNDEDDNDDDSDDGGGVTMTADDEDDEDSEDEDEDEDE